MLGCVDLLFQETSVLQFSGQYVHILVGFHILWSPQYAVYSPTLMSLLLKSLPYFSLVELVEFSNVKPSML